MRPPISRSSATDSSITVNVVANDNDPEGDALSVIALSEGINGTATINDDQSIAYEPAPNWSGIEILVYTASGSEFSDDASVTIVVTEVNDAPEAVADAKATNEDTSLAVDVMANHGDVEGNPLSVTSITSGTNISATINADDAISFVPDQDWEGTESFAYQISDGNGGSDSTSVTITVDAVNDTPIANADTYEVGAYGARLSPLDNDSDPESEVLSIVDVSAPRLGVQQITAADSTIAYTPHPGASGEEQLTYSISDGKTQATGLITISIADPPTKVAFTDSDSKKDSQLDSGSGDPKKPASTDNTIADTTADESTMDEATTGNSTDSESPMTEAGTITLEAAETQQELSPAEADAEPAPDPARAAVALDADSDEGSTATRFAMISLLVGIAVIAGTGIIRFVVRR